jgi:hypothetical protein
VPHQGHAHEDSGHALGHGLEGVQVGALIVGMPRRVKVVIRMPRRVAPAVGSRIVLKSCSKILVMPSRVCRIKGYEETKVLEPESTGQEKTSPPCCVSTHCSRVVDPCRSPTV